MPVGDIQGPRITEIEEEKTEQKLDIDPKYWIVMLYANWSVSCLNFEAVLAKLSIQYDLPHLKFGMEENTTLTAVVVSDNHKKIYRPSGH